MSLVYKKMQTLGLQNFFLNGQHILPLHNSMGTHTVDLGPEDRVRELAAHAFAPSSASRLHSLKRVYDPVDHEVQLRLVAPEGSINRLEYPGEDTRPLGIREKILLEYHNGKIGGHLGAEKTARRILQDWYWPGMYDAVDRWCSMCD